MTHTSASDALAMLNGSHVIFVGDSMARRSARQLQVLLTGSTFHDAPTHLSMAMHVDVTTPAGRHVVNITSHWTPTLKILHAKQDQLFRRSTPSVRKVVVVTLSTHDFAALWTPHDYGNDTRTAQHAPVARAWHTAPETALQPWVKRTVKEIQRMTRALAVHDRDVVLVRLPIAQACHGKYPDECTDGAAANGTHGASLPDDPHNDFVDIASRMLGAALWAQFGDGVGQLPTAVWTRNPDGVGRHACAGSDHGGTHFVLEPVRLAYLQQVLHGVAVMAVDRPVWRSTPWYQRAYAEVPRC